MKILFEVKKVTRPNLLPKIKQGVEFFEVGNNRIYIGNLKGGIQVENIPISLIRSFNGRKTLSQIAENTLVKPELIDELIELLLAHQLIDIYPTKLIFEDRFHSKKNGATKPFENDVAVRDFEQKIAAESALTTFRSGINDGGKPMLSRRQQFEIKIMGDEELSIALYVSLLSSGFTSTLLEINRDVQMDDLRSGILQLGDVGRKIQETLERLKKVHQLFKDGEQHQKASTLVIYFGRPNEKLIQEWMSQDILHLTIESIGPNVVIGPIVLPGQSPCLNCVTKVDTKILRNIKEISAFQRPAIGALNWITGYLNLAVAEFVDTGSSPLIGCAKVFDFVNPNEIREIKYPRHPACGCNWL